MELEEAAQAETPTPESPKKTLWELLNAPFVLFVMTSIVVSGLSFSYQGYTNYQKQADNRKLSISHLKTEIR